MIHAELRKDFWQYAPQENLTADQLLKKKYQGIRPAPGYPACPDHSEKKTIFKLLEAEKHTGLRLTANWMTEPLPSVCGYILAAPAARYFNITRIGRDQLLDYSRRTNKSESLLRKILGKYIQV